MWFTEFWFYNGVDFGSKKNLTIEYAVTTYKRKKRHLAREPSKAAVKRNTIFAIIK